MKTKIWRIGIRIFGDSDVVNKLVVLFLTCNATKCCKFAVQMLRYKKKIQLSFEQCYFLLFYTYTKCLKWWILYSVRNWHVVVLQLKKRQHNILDQGHLFCIKCITWCLYFVSGLCLLSKLLQYILIYSPVQLCMSSE